MMQHMANTTELPDPGAQNTVGETNPYWSCLCTRLISVALVVMSCSPLHASALSLPLNRTHTAAEACRPFFSMAARNWRLIDIDQYEDGILTLEDLVDPDPRSPQEAASEAKNKSSEVRTLLQKWVRETHLTRTSISISANIRQSLLQERHSWCIDSCALRATIRQRSRGSQGV